MACYNRQWQSSSDKRTDNRAGVAEKPSRPQWQVGGGYAESLEGKYCILKTQQYADCAQELTEIVDKCSRSYSNAHANAHLPILISFLAFNDWILPGLHLTHKSHWINRACRLMSCTQPYFNTFVAPGINSDIYTIHPRRSLPGLPQIEINPFQAMTSSRMVETMFRKYLPSAKVDAALPLGARIEARSSTQYEAVWMRMTVTLTQTSGLQSVSSAPVPSIDTKKVTSAPAAVVVANNRAVSISAEQTVQRDNHSSSSLQTPMATPDERSTTKVVVELDRSCSFQHDSESLIKDCTPRPHAHEHTNSLNPDIASDMKACNDEDVIESE